MDVEMIDRLAARLEVAQERLDTLDPGSPEWEAVHREVLAIQRAATDLAATTGTPPDALAYAAADLLAPEPPEPED